MADDLIPSAALQAAAAAIEMRLVSDSHYELGTDSNEDLARAALEAALPHIWKAWQGKAPPLAWQQAAMGVEPYDPETWPTVDLEPEEAEAFLDTIRRLRGQAVGDEQLYQLAVYVRPGEDALLVEALTRHGWEVYRSWWTRSPLGEQ